MTRSSGLVGAVVRKELREVTRDGRLVVTALAVLLLLVIAIVASAERGAREREAHRAATAAMHQQWLEQGEKNPHSAAHYGIYAFRPTSALGFADPGITPFSGSAVWLEAHKQNDVVARPADDGTAADRFGVLSPALVLLVLAPLVIILIGFAAFAGEREGGTLRVLAASGISPRVLFAGKALSLGAALLVWLAPAALAGLAALLLGGEPGWPARAGLFAAAYALYFAGWLGLALGVSARATTARAALVVLLLVWVTNVFVAPRLSVEVARLVAPPPTTSDFYRSIAAAKGHGADGQSAYQARRQAVERELFARYGVSRSADLPVNFDAVNMQRDEEYGNAIYDRAFGALYDGLEASARARAALGLVAPALAARSISQGAAGTDIAHQRDFVGQAESHRRPMIAALNGDMAIHSKSGDWDYKASRALWETIPEFLYRPPSPASVARAQALPFAALLLWAVGAFWFARRAAARMEVL